MSADSTSIDTSVIFTPYMRHDLINNGGVSVNPPKIGSIVPVLSVAGIYSDIQELLQAKIQLGGSTTPSTQKPVKDSGKAPIPLRALSKHFQKIGLNTLIF